MGGLPWSSAFSTRLRIIRRSKVGSPRTVTGCPVDAAILVARAFLGRERDQLDALAHIETLGRVEAAEQQDLVHELVELGDVSRQLRPALRVRLDQLETEPDAGERRPQLMRRIGEQQLVGVDQALDPRGGLIEALSQAGDLVAALDLDARAQIAGAERLDAALQSLEPSGEPPHDRQRAERDRKRDASQESRKHERAGTLPMRHARDQPASVLERDRDRGPGGRSQPSADATTLAGGRQRTTGGRQRLLVGAEQCQIPSEPLRQPLDGLLLNLARRVRRRNQLGDELARELERLAERRNARDEVPKQARREHDQHAGSPRS